MLLYFVSCISFLLLLKPVLSLKPLPSWAGEVRLISPLFYKDLPVKLFRKRLWFGFLGQIPTRMSQVKKAHTCSKVENVEDSQDMSVLDLPDLVLECILEKLPPPSLCQMVGVCRSLREWCVSDHLWERHMKQKWGRVIGQAAYREWKWYVASKGNVGTFRHSKQWSLMRLVSFSWPFSWIRTKVDANNSIIKQQPSYLPADSFMTWYLALETGNFWFPAQVYNRENGHVGFMLSCYDAELSYDPHTDTFQARYPPHGRRAVAIEHGIPWERIRAPPVDTRSHDLHISDCLNDLHPGDHVEIQWRRNKEFPYGWWYGCIGHLELCDGNENYCRCHSSDTVVLEFKQYAPDSRWRKTTISRKDHREEGHEADGFYGGIRKIKSEAEIAIWKSIWPSEVLD